MNDIEQIWVFDGVYRGHRIDVAKVMQGAKVRFRACVDGKTFGHFETLENAEHQARVEIDCREWGNA